MGYWFMQFTPGFHAMDKSGAADPWKLVWYEQFRGSEVDPDRWNVLDDSRGDGQRSQHYKPENIEIDEGVLKIHTKEEASEGFPYTSGALTTKGKVLFKYGKLEVRAKLPAGQGLLPAIWLWNNQGKEFPEIDIVEMLGQEPGQLWNTIHYEVNGTYGRDFTMTNLPDLTTDYHTYGIEWEPEKITFLVDGAPVFTSTEYVPQEDMYLFINTAVGGNWVEEPDSTTELPAQMLIDWIRYYQK
ncbi:glycoside hydrolase family 16 protein [Planococcus sp. YIM B11945]|uniref:glycoside hydrolase family 16 protein n=1 Tax=Planococcus sp. YIM B11945 TaxID=3435410 RepID=UPI003D7E106C